ncbi:MAG: hypothetical protein SGPRY_008392, partial [Prymnesium sp.]
RRFNLDGSVLHAKYKALVAQHHPDRAASQGERAVQEANEAAAQITEAYSVLRHPHRRAAHLLSLLGMPITEEMNGAELGATFLSEVMEVREMLEESAGDALSMAAARQANQARVDEICGELQLAFDGSDLERARVLTAQLQYLQRIEEEINSCTDPT